jgi:uridine phosphorylase
MSEDPRYHVKVGPGAVGGYVLMPGDRDRVPRIAKQLDGAKLVAENREYRTMTGSLDGVPVSVVSSGMGAPCITIGIEELRTAGVHTVIRIGTTGAVGPGPRLGESIIALGAVRTEGTSRAYVDLEYPAVADLDVVVALRDAARAAGAAHHVGIVESSDAYYAGAWLREQAEPRAERLRRAGLLAIEMEASALFVVGRLHGLRTGCILTLREESTEGGRRKQGGPVFERGLDRSIAVAVDAVRRLIELDAERGGRSPDRVAGVGGGARPRRSARSPRAARGTRARRRRT